MCPPFPRMRSSIGKSLTIALLIVFIAGTSARAYPQYLPQGPHPAVFSTSEVTQFEDAQLARYNRLVLSLAGGSVAALLAAGVTLLAVGLGGNPGSSAMATGGIGCLSLATIATFMGLEAYQW